MTEKRSATRILKRVGLAVSVLIVVAWGISTVWGIHWIGTTRRVGLETGMFGFALSSDSGLPVISPWSRVYDPPGWQAARLPTWEWETISHHFPRNYDLYLGFCLPYFSRSEAEVVVHTPRLPAELPVAESSPIGLSAETAPPETKSESGDPGQASITMTFVLFPFWLLLLITAVPTTLLFWRDRKRGSRSPDGESESDDVA